MLSGRIDALTITYISNQHHAKPIVSTQVVPVPVPVPTSSSLCSVLNLVRSTQKDARIRSGDLDSLISMWLPRACAQARGLGQLTVMAQAAGRAHTAFGAADSGAAGRATMLLLLRLAAKTNELMEQDEDDLFFEQGQTRSEFLNALVRHNVRLT